MDTPLYYGQVSLSNDTYSVSLSYFTLLIRTPVKRMQTWHECDVFFSATAKWSEANNKMFDFNVYVLLFFSLRIFMLFL